MESNYKQRTIKDMLIDSINDKKSIIEYVNGHTYEDTEKNDYVISFCRELILDKFKSILATLENHLKISEENDK
jgi:hypothetical protein